MAKSEIIKDYGIGILTAVLVFFLIGIPTDIVPNSWYIRMMEPTFFQYFFFVLVTILSGIFAGLFSYVSRTKKTCSSKFGYLGIIGSWFAIACPLCISFLTIIMGSSIMLSYFAPFQPFLGFFSISILSYGIFRLWRQIK
jgi:hypothetical protein